MRSLRLLAIAAATACGGDRSPSPPADARAAPKTAAPHDADAEPTQAGEYIAVVVAGRSVDVAPTTTGMVRQVLVRPGDLVVEGQALATIDARAVHEDLAIGEAELRRQRAAVERARIDAQEAKARLAELERLAEAGHAAGREVSDAQFALRRANAAVSQGKAAVDESRGRMTRWGRALDETSVVAPFAGRVAERYVDAGVVASPGDPIVRVIADDRWLRVAVPPDDAARIVPGTSLRARLESQTDTRSATVRHTAPALDAASGMFIIEAELDAHAEVPWPVGAAVFVDHFERTIARE